MTKRFLRMPPPVYRALPTRAAALIVVKETRLEPNDTYYDIDVALSTNFGNLSYVYVIENKLLEEQQTLEQNLSTK